MPPDHLTPFSEPNSTKSALLGVIIGADSLRGRRSGIGRMTLEIIESVRNRPEIGSLRLLMDGRLQLTDDVLSRMRAGAAESLVDPPPPVLSEAAPPTLQKAKRLIGSVPGIQLLRALKQRVVQHSVLAEMAKAARSRVLYHEPNMITQPFDGPTVVTVNDLSWHHHPEYHPSERLAWINRNLRRTLDAATRFVAISRFTANAMVHELGIDAGKIDVVALAAGSQFIPMSGEDAAPALALYGLQDQSYVLSVSTLEPRKNFDRLVAAHLALPVPLRRRFPLVIAGGSGWGSALCTRAVEQARQEGSLRLLGHVNDADLLALYARAALFAYVSLYEGFGLPVLEAMATGAPVLASSTTATAETAGDAAILIDPMNVPAITEGLRRILEDPAAAANLRARSLAHAATFTWDRTASELIRTWRQSTA